MQALAVPLNCQNYTLSSSRERENFISTERSLCKGTASTCLLTIESSIRELFVSGSFFNGLYCTMQVKPYTSEISSYFTQVDEIKASSDYPSITEYAKKMSKSVLSLILENFSLAPVRISSSVEGGIAIVYRKTKKRFPAKKNIELFIEVYNDNSYIVSILKNLNIVRMDEGRLYDDSIIYDTCKDFLQR